MLLVGKLLVLKHKKPGLFILKRQNNVCNIIIDKGFYLITDFIEVDNSGLLEILYKNQLVLIRFKLSEACLLTTL
jgi:hypothetical protein